MSETRKKPVIAIAGQPNTGKSTLFNTLTGLNQAVGNWPGKTVEKKSGSTLCGRTAVELVDLPGTYSLTASSTEERIARDFILDGAPDLVLVVVNALCLDRSLYYTAEVAAMGIPYAVALNMTDMAENAGVPLDPALLSEKLGVPVFSLVANRGKGIVQLKDGLEQALSISPISPISQKRQEDIEWLDGGLQKVHEMITEKILPLARSHRRAVWEALKFMENDADIRHDLGQRNPEILAWGDKQLAAIPNLTEQLAEARYRWIKDAVRDTSAKRVRPAKKTRIIDAIATHPLLGVLLLLAIFVTLVTVGLLAGFSFGLPARSGFDALEEIAGQKLAFSGTPWLGWVVRGAIRGAGSVVTVTPVIAIFTLFFAFLEDVGYMSRAAYVMDRLMSRIGLNGRSFVPLLFGMPCTIIGAMACRIGDSARQRLLTLLLVPLVPCTAKLCIVSVIASWFFPLPVAVGVVLGLFLTNCCILGLLCRIFDHILFPGRTPDPLIMEMPPYQRPAWRAIFKHTWNRSVSFVRRAATVLVVFSALLSIACYFPTGEITTSLFSRLGHVLEPLGQLMGLDWKMFTVLLASVLNKEAMLATAAVIYNVGQQELPALIKATVSTSGALTFMYAVNVFVPCAASLSVIYVEGGKRFRVLAGIIAYTTALSIGGGIVLYQLTRLISG